MELRGLATSPKRDERVDGTEDMSSLERLSESALEKEVETEVKD